MADAGADPRHRGRPTARRTHDPPDGGRSAGDAGRAPSVDHPRRGLGDARVDRLTGVTTVMMGSRQHRPNRPGGRCPFCVGGSETPEPYEVLSVPNRWPSFPGDRCEVVLYTPEHDAGLAEMGTGAVRSVVDLWADRTARLGARDDVDYVLVFENRGDEVGATISHPHGQIYAFDRVPDRPLDELRRTARDQCPLCDRPDPALLVAEADGWCASVPAASPDPYTLLLAPHVHRPDLPSLDGPQRDGLAGLLVEIVGRLDRLFGAPLPYMLWVHQRPTDGGRWPEAHVHLHVVSPMRAPGVQRYVAAAELGSGLFVNPVVPEDAASALRGA